MVKKPLGIASIGAHSSIRSVTEQRFLQLTINSTYHLMQLLLNLNASTHIHRHGKLAPSIQRRELNAQLCRLNSLALCLLHQL